MNYKIETISNTVLAVHIASVNAFLLTVPAHKIFKVENYSVGVSANFRLFTTITYIQ